MTTNNPNLQVQPEEKANSNPLCPNCGLPMTFQRRGYSYELDRTVDLYYCENKSDGYPKGCWTQARIPVR